MLYYYLLQSIQYGSNIIKLNHGNFNWTVLLSIIPYVQKVAVMIRELSSRCSWLPALIMTGHLIETWLNIFKKSSQFLPLPVCKSYATSPLMKIARMSLSFLRRQSKESSSGRYLFLMSLKQLQSASEIILNSSQNLGKQYDIDMLLQGIWGSETLPVHPNAIYQILCPSKISEMGHFCTQVVYWSKFNAKLSQYILFMLLPFCTVTNDLWQLDLVLNLIANFQVEPLLKQFPKFSRTPNGLQS